MESRVTPPPSTLGLQTGQPPPQPARRDEGKEAKSISKYTPSPASEQRLLIEPVGRSYVYKIVDRKTGEVIWQYPMEDVLKMRSQETYSAGTVIRTTA